jgi:LysR family hca operon transcriptional activator
MELGFTILPGYIALLTMNNSMIQPLDVKLLYLDLHVSYRKESNSVAVKKSLKY